MKRLLQKSLLGAVLLFGLHGTAGAQVKSTEYYFDVDPGFGQGTALPFYYVAQDTTFTFSAAIGGLSNGLHKLHVRSCDTARKAWSQSIPKLFYKQAVLSNTLTNIVRAEYFFDTDPGFGLATNVPFTAGQDITFGFSSSIASLAAGLHRLYVRTQDANGRWSYSAPQFFYKDASATAPLANIVKAECFFDNDPGFGAATSVSVTAGTDISFNLNGSITALGNGLHHFYVRTQDANGRWSITAAQLFYKEAAASISLPNIVKLEYFFDADPGVGLGTDVPVTAGQDIVATNFSAGISSLGAGMHRLYVRSRDAAGRWSLSAAQMFFKEPSLSNPLANITKTEYFFDTDPGYGNGTDIPVTAGTDITFNYNPSVAPLSTSAFHRLFIRSRDANGKWSMTASQLFYLPPAVPPAPVKITKLEYYIDNDPGFGAATNVPFAKALDVTINFNASIAALGTGIHYLAVRSQDSIGRWSHTSVQMFYREPAVSNPLASITKGEYFIDNDPGVGVATNVPLTAGQDITFGFSASLAGINSGLHRLYLRSRDASGKWSLSAPQLFYYEPISSTPLANIVKAEYFFDNDPGFGSATAVAFTSGQDISIPFTAAIATLPNGAHRLVVRTQDAGGKWSMSTPQLFFKEPVNNHTPGYLTKLEWFWDTDPGFGAATAVSVPANTVDLVGYNFTVPVPTGWTGQRHYLFLRAKDDWGLTAVKEVTFPGVALPLTLLEFSARREEQQVRLDWKAMDEQGLAQYVVERSGDGRNFDSIGVRKALGGNADYLLYDEHPRRGMNYYHLRQMEAGCGIKYSATVSVMFSEFAGDLSIYPNPAGGHFSISAKVPLASVRLTDVGGKTVRRYDDVSGNYNLEGIAAGIYVVEIAGADGSVVLKPLVVR